MQQRTFEMLHVSPSWRFYRLKKADLSKFFKGEWNWRETSPLFRIRLRRTGGLLDEFEELRNIDYNKDDTFEVMLRLPGGGRKRTHAEMEDTLTAAMNEVRPENPFASVVQSLAHDVNQNSNNVFATLIAQLGVE